MAFAAASPSGFSHVSASLMISRSMASQFLAPVRLDVGYAIPFEYAIPFDGAVVVGDGLAGRVLVEVLVVAAVAG